MLLGKIHSCRCNVWLGWIKSFNGYLTVVIASSVKDIRYTGCWSAWEKNLTSNGTWLTSRKDLCCIPDNSELSEISNLRLLCLIGLDNNIQLFDRYNSIQSIWITFFEFLGGCMWRVSHKGSFSWETSTTETVLVLPNQQLTHETGCFLGCTQLENSWAPMLSMPGSEQCTLTNFWTCRKGSLRRLKGIFANLFGWGYWGRCKALQDQALGSSADW